MSRTVRAQWVGRRDEGLGRKPWMPLALGLVMLAVGTVAERAEAAKTTEISTTPALYPPFSAGVHDYVVSCGGEPVEVEVEAARRTKVAVDRRRARSGRFKAGTRLAPGQAFEFKIETGAEEQTYHVRCLAEDFVGWTWNRHAKPAEKWYLVTPGGTRNTIFFDRRGVPVWCGSSSISNLGSWISARAIINLRLRPPDNVREGSSRFSQSPILPRYFSARSYADFLLIP